MSKFLTKMIRKPALLTVILAILLALGTCLGAVFGLHKNTAVSDSKMLTVSVSQYLYRADMKQLKEECDKVLSIEDVVYEIYGEMNGDESEIVFVLDSNEDVTVAKEKLEKRFAELTGAEGEWNGWTIIVSDTKVETVSSLAKNYVLRGVIAGVIFAVLAFVYTVIRYKWCMGFVMAICTVLGMGLTTALIATSRILVTSTVMYSIMGAGLLTAVFVLFSFSRIRTAEKAENAAEKSTEQIVLSSLATKETAIFGILLGAAILLTGILSSSPIAWFAVSALIALAVSVFLGWIYAPAIYAPMKEYGDKKFAAKKKAYKGAKALDKKAKKEENNNESEE